LLFQMHHYEHQDDFLERNQHIAIWEGENWLKNAPEVTGIKTVYWLQDFEKVLFEMMTHCDTIYINEHYRATVETETREAVL
jgi:Xaa-Pro aminopeptidase